MALIHIQIILTVSHLEKLRMPSVEKEKRIQLITLKEISEQTHMRKNGKKNYSTNVVVESFRLLDA